MARAIALRIDERPKQASRTTASQRRSWLIVTGRNVDAVVHSSTSLHNGLVDGVPSYLASLACLAGGVLDRRYTIRF